MENFFVYTHNKSKDLYIDGVGRDAISIFSMFINRGINVKGFVSDEYAGADLLNKVIVNYRDVPSDGIIYGGVECFEINAYVTNHHRLTYIYGAGDIGRSVLIHLRNKGIEVSGFIDSDKNLWGESIEDCNIFSPRILPKLQKEVTIILASRKYVEMYDIVNSFNPLIDICYIDSVIGEIEPLKIYDDLTLDYTQNVIPLLEYVRGRKLYMFYENEDWKRENRVIQKILNLFDLVVLQLSSIDDLTKLKSEFSLILLTREEMREKEKFLKQNGLSFFRDYICIDKFSSLSGKPYKFILDFNLGYSLVDYYDKESSGFRIIQGGEGKKKISIAVLGDSTACGIGVAFPSWTDVLVEILKNEYEIILYEGAVPGYTSSQEMIKLIRDVIPLRPDIVISYTGLIDTFIKAEDHYSCGVYEKIFKLANSKMSTEIHGFDFNISNLKQANGGKINRKDNFQNWIDNLRIMKAITNEFGIEYIACFHPMFGTKKRTKREDVLWNLCQEITGVYYEENMRLFHEKIQNIAYDYIIDFSNILDEINDVYYDTFHIWEKGNRVVAEKMSQIIRLYQST